MERFSLYFETTGRGSIEITSHINERLKNTHCSIGLCHLFLQHTSASLIICENYDAQVRLDLEQFLVRLVRDGDPLFKHTLEGEDDMPAHIRTILTQTSLTLPIQDQQLTLGTWQGIYLYEHRFHPQKRHLLVTVME